MKRGLSTLWYWRVAICRALIYCALTAGGTFLGLTEVFSDKTWAEMGWFTRIRIFLACAISGGTTLIAFLDSTMQALRGQRGTGHTAFIGRGDDTDR